MPSILKGFHRPKVEAYDFPLAEELTVEEDPLPLPELVDGPAEENHEPPPGPENPVGYAKVQAEAILADAHRRAEAIVEQAQREMAEQIEQARLDGRDAGYRAGYVEGLDKAGLEVRIQAEQKAAALEAEIARFLENATHIQERLMDGTAGELRDLALSVAERVVRISLKSSGEVVGRMIQGAIEKLKRREWVHIYIAGCDAKQMAEISPALSGALAAVSSNVKIIPMADDESGTCIIEMPDEIIDASASTQMNNIRDMLADVPFQ